MVNRRANLRFALRLVWLMWLIPAALVGCGGGAQPSENLDPDTVEITLSGVNPDNGVFDPAPVTDGPGQLWMSFSAVEVSPVDPVLSHVGTRIASSDDGGLSWQDNGNPPNTPQTFAVPNATTPDPGDTLNATWQYEVSRLVYDPHDIEARRWKVFWHRFLGVNLGGTRHPLYEHGWIGMKSAASPDGPWSTERKLFVGTVYDAAANDATLGPPEFDLPALFPGETQLGRCLAFSEPGVRVTSDGIYISLLCAAADARADGKIVLLGCDHALSSCNYLGAPLRNTEAAQFEQAGQDLAGFSASELFSAQGNEYLMVTPNEPVNDIYRGCLVFRFTDLANAQLQRDQGQPTLIARIEGEPDSFRGACGYHPGLTASGVLLSQHTSEGPNFHVVATGVQLP